MIYGRDSIQRMIEGQATRLENGDYASVEGTWGDPIRCDAYPSAGRAAVLPFADGKRSEYTYEVHLDVTEDPFEPGQRVRLTANGHVTELTVKGWHRYSFIAKLWL